LIIFHHDGTALSPLPFLPVLVLIDVAVVLVAIGDDAVVWVFLLFELVVAVFTLSYVSRATMVRLFPLPLLLVVALVSVLVVFVNGALISVFAVDCVARSVCLILCYHTYRLIVNQSHPLPCPFRSINNF
jgi:hypothetical protein